MGTTVRVHQLHPPGGEPFERVNLRGIDDVLNDTRDHAASLGEARWRRDADEVEP